MTLWNVSTFYGFANISIEGGRCTWVCFLYCVWCARDSCDLFTQNLRLLHQHIWLSQCDLCKPRGYPESHVGWAYVGPLSEEQYRNWDNVGPAYVAVLVWIMSCTVYTKKYPHGFCFAVLCCGYTLTDFPISIRLTSLALWQSNDCPGASKATLMNMDKYFMWINYERLHNHNKAKHNKTVCILLGIYCST